MGKRIGLVVCADCVDPEGAMEAASLCSKLCGGVPFRVFSDRGGTDTVPRIGSKAEYSRFMVESLPRLVKGVGGHVLVVQRDGVVANPDAWEPGFLDYDYVGAPWPDGVVGNGGFSLRSARLLAALPELGPCQGPEDEHICRVHRAELESMGMRFAPREVAARFSWERNCANPCYRGAYGIHLDGPAWRFMDGGARAMCHPLSAAYLAKHRNF
jgi:hypothetical protein